ncbi:hypothetical protein [Geodermatophilus telluris]|nr:hypothetical protein [Geodermatophilus telluris]
MTSTRIRPVPSPVARRRRSRWVVGAVAATALVGGLAAATQVRHDSTSSVVPGVREVVVDIGAGPVTLRGGDGDAVGVRSTPHGLFTSSAAPRHELVDGVLRITSGCSGFALHCWTEEEVTVPAGVPVRVHTGVGDVTAVDLDVPLFEVGAGAGTVTATFTGAPGEVRVDAGAAGNVEVVVPDGRYRVDADATVGPTEVQVDHDASAGRSIDASTGVGQVTVRSR